MGLPALRERRRTGLAGEAGRWRGGRRASGALAKAGNGYIEAPEGSIAIAAADITAACQGHPSGELPENVADWETAHGREITAEDVELALEAVERVAGEKSELAELWDDADEPEWREPLDDLAERLRTALR
jgi:Domain of unknown function (DUF4259)